MAAPAPDDVAMDVYQDICNNIRVTDEISFKLLGIVPLASGVGAAALTLADKTNLLRDFPHVEKVVIVLSILGAAITFALFRWELRNIQKCIWLISRAAKFETEVLRKPKLQFDGTVRKIYLEATDLSQIRVPGLGEFPWGKAHAERVVYLASIAGWLVPLGIAVYKIIRQGW